MLPAHVVFQNRRSRGITVILRARVLEMLSAKSSGRKSSSFFLCIPSGIVNGHNPRFNFWNRIVRCPLLSSLNRAIAALRSTEVKV
jgi:hypothetical protein